METAIIAAAPAAKGGAPSGGQGLQTGLAGKKDPSFGDLIQGLFALRDLTAGNNLKGPEIPSVLAQKMAPEEREGLLKEGINLQLYFPGGESPAASGDTPLLVAGELLEILLEEGEAVSASWQFSLIMLAAFVGEGPVEGGELKGEADLCSKGLLEKLFPAGALQDWGQLQPEEKTFLLSLLSWAVNLGEEQAGADQEHVFELPLKVLMGFEPEGEHEAGSSKEPEALQMKSLEVLQGLLRPEEQEALLAAQKAATGKLEELLQKLPPPSGEEVLLEDKLRAGTAFMLDEKGRLTPQASLVVASHLEKGGSLADLPGEFREKLEEELAAYFSRSGAEDPPRKVESFFSRVEKFFKHLLGREQAAGAQSDGAGRGTVSNADPGEKFSAEGGRDNSMVFLARGAEGFAMAGREGARQVPYAAGLQPQEVLNQVVDKMPLLNRPGLQELRVSLQPPELGELLIRLRRVKGVLSAEIMTQNVAVKELLEGQMDLLRQRLQQINLNVEEFNVFVRDEGKGDTGSGEGAAPEQDLSSSLTVDRSSAEDEESESSRQGLEEGSRVDYLV